MPRLIHTGNPNCSTVRTQLRVLEEKGHVAHDEDGLRYIYAPAAPRRAARKSALRHLVDTFFDGSPENAVAAILGGQGTKLSDEQLDRIAALVKKVERAAWIWRARSAATSSGSCWRRPSRSLRVSRGAYEPC